MHGVRMRAHETGYGFVIADACTWKQTALTVLLLSKTKSSSHSREKRFLVVTQLVRQQSIYTLNKVTIQIDLCI